MTAKLEQFLYPSLFSNIQKSQVKSTNQKFSYENELQELIDLAGDQFTEKVVRAALMHSKGDIDEAYDLLLSGEQISSVEEAKVESSGGVQQEKTHCCVILHLFRNLAHFQRLLVDVNSRPRYKHKEQIRFSNLKEQAWFEGKSGIIGKREKKPVFKQIRISNYNYFRKRFKK